MDDIQSNKGAITACRAADLPSEHGLAWVLWKNSSWVSAPTLKCSEGRAAADEWDTFEGGLRNVMDSMWAEAPKKVNLSGHLTDPRVAKLMGTVGGKHHHFFFSYVVHFPHLPHLTPLITSPHLPHLASIACFTSVTSPQYHLSRSSGGPIRGILVYTRFAGPLCEPNGYMYKGNSGKWQVSDSEADLARDRSVLRSKSMASLPSEVDPNSWTFFNHKTCAWQPDPSIRCTEGAWDVPYRFVFGG